MKILVVEDDPSVVNTLRHLLSSYHYAVDFAIDGEAGLEMAQAFDYELMLLDVLLPRLDGISLCQLLREQGMQMPILLLTGQGGTSQKAIALNAGADDYLVKPFETEELIARVQALLRRGGPKSKPLLTWGSLSMDPNRRMVSYGTHFLEMTPKEYAILELFLRNSQKVLSMRGILDQVWRSVESPGEETVRVHIKDLRKKLNAVGAPKDFIKTIYRTGYQLNPLYSSVLTGNFETSLTMSQIAELTTLNETLRAKVDSLLAEQVELRQKNQALAMTEKELEKEMEKAQSQCQQLKQQLDDCTTLIAVYYP